MTSILQKAYVTDTATNQNIILQYASTFTSN